MQKQTEDVVVSGALRAETRKPRYPLGVRGFERDLGDDLLFHLLGSTIGAAGLNFSVRNGKRWNTRAIITEIKLGHVAIRPMQSISE